MAFRPLDGPRLPPARGPATSMVVLVHGYGADGNDLISLAQHWQGLLPGTAFVSPHAPDPVPGAPSGFQWFALTRRDPPEMQKGVRDAAPGLVEFLRLEAGRLGLGLENVALVGFSQGTMLSLQVGLRRATAAIVGYSGMLAGTPPKLGSDAPPILLVHGAADPMIPATALFTSAAALGRAGASVQWHVSQGLGHSIDEAGLALGGTFLAMAFRGLLGRKDGEICCSVG
jgi:phospholipase/carboxylesterase